ncbi:MULTISPECIES: DUF1963 domain-containing protein [Lysobacteraceae]|nr:MULTISPECIES: DUF1963 domain-containing protein [Lysobacter]
MFGWFRRRKPLSLPQLEALADRQARLAVHLRSAEPPQGRSRLGGRPPLPPDTPWPVDAGVPMVCLGTLDLDEIAALGVLPWLPQEGQLLFFCNPETDGEDGTLPCCVLHAPQPGTGASEATPDDTRIRPLVARAFASLPSRERLEREAGPFTSYREHIGDYEALLNARFGGQLRHQVGGYPAVVQYDDMERLCAERTNAKFGTMQSPPDDWCLLLQVDGEDDRLLPWTDWGTFYFWIERTAAERSDFRNVQLLFQTT